MPKEILDQPLAPQQSKPPMSWLKLYFGLMTGSAFLASIAVFWWGKQGLGETWMSGLDIGVGHFLSYAALFFAAPFLLFHFFILFWHMLLDAFGDLTLEVKVFYPKPVLGSWLIKIFFIETSALAAVGLVMTAMVFLHIGSHLVFGVDFGALAQKFLEGREFWALVGIYWIDFLLTFRYELWPIYQQLKEEEKK